MARIQSPCYNYKAVPNALKYRYMTTTLDKSVLYRRVLIATVALAAIVLLGAVLFLLFARDGRPLLEIGLNLTQTTTT